MFMCLSQDGNSFLEGPFLETAPGDKGTEITMPAHSRPVVGWDILNLPAVGGGRGLGADLAGLGGSFCKTSLMPWEKQRKTGASLANQPWWIVKAVIKRKHKKSHWNALGKNF